MLNLERLKRPFREKNMKFRVSAISGLMVAVLLTVWSGPAWATNGMNMISHGGQESGMGGASLGVSDNAMAVNNNPAGLTRVGTKNFVFSFGLLMPDLNHQDAIGGSRDGKDNIFPLPSLAYAHNFGRLTLGIGAFAQGGMGAEFNDIPTAFGTVDDVYTNVAYLKFAPALAYEVNDKLSVGVALNVGYSTLEMKFFPDTVVPPNPLLPTGFNGLDLKDVSGFGYGAKMGLMYKHADNLSFGLVYTTKSHLAYEDGILNVAGFGAFPAEVDGFNWPESVGAGVGWRPTDKLLLAFDVTWYNWNAALNTVSIKFNTPLGPQAANFLMNWKDQYVFALGAAYDLNESLTLRAGYNYGSNPVPSETLSPLFPAIPEHHLTLGMGYKITPALVFDAAIEYAFEKSVTYTNPLLPFGPNAVEAHSQIIPHVALSYTW